MDRQKAEIRPAMAAIPVIVQVDSGERRFRDSRRRFLRQPVPGTKNEYAGAPEIEHEELFNASLLVAGDRWTDEGYGYAEPLQEAIDNIESLVDHFLPLANLTLAGGFVHPLKNHQVELPL
jgi:hypothetical protein